LNTNDPSLLITGANIITHDRERPSADSILVHGDRIIAAGNEEEIKKRVEENSFIHLKLSGQTILPGFTDSHIHLGSLSRRKVALDVSGTRSREGLFTFLENASSRKDPKSWIWCEGLNENNWQDNIIPRRWDLDRLNLPNPVLINRVCTHVSIANSVAMERAGVETDSEGLLLEEQTLLFQQTMWLERTNDKISEEDLLLESCKELAENGITSVHTCDSPSYGLGENISVYKNLLSRQMLPLRATIYSERWPEGEGEDLASVPQGNRIMYGGLKVFLDGSIGGYTAALSAPYEDRKDSMGLLNYETKELKDLIVLAEENNIQIAFHVIGDRALDQLLDALGSLKRYIDIRHRVIHLQVCRPEQLKKLRDLDLVCDIQPVFVPSEIQMAYEKLGQWRIKWSYPWKDLLESGLLLTGSSDAPVEEPNPLVGIWAAVNRTDYSGDPQSVFRPDQCLDLMAAISLFTSNPAIATGSDIPLGRIKGGFLADLVVLDRNIKETERSEIREIRPLYTFSGGRLSYGKIESWPSFTLPKRDLSLAR